MKKFLAILLLGLSNLVTAQTVQTTPNLITSGTNHTWYGVTTGTIPGNYMPGGPQPKYDPATNTIAFSYGSASIGQTYAVNQALANVGAGVKINGYTYSYDVRNMNGDDRQPGVDSFTVSQILRGPSNSVLLSSSQYYNTKFEWRTVTGSRTATTPYNIADTSYIQFGVQGVDSGYWGGYFGPQIRNVDMRLNYTVDPCVTNPAYSPSCAGYNTVSISNNLVPNPTAYASSGSSIDQSYAINQALSLAGAGATIHGFQWGYTANTNGPYCAFWLIVCLDNRVPSVTTNVDITDSNNNSIYSIARTYTNSYNTTSYQYLFPSSRAMSSLGRFNFTATTNDQAYIGDVWSKALYTPDPCAIDPLSSNSCPGYAAAYTAQQCTISALYNSSCPGYQVAYFNQQCTINQLYNQSCPGYAAAYLVQQCSINPLYSTTCSGYDTAYFNQQCSLNPLYDSRCNGYATAYHDQQCSINQLYATNCPGYTQAYFDQQCRLNSLYDRMCPNYNEAYAKKYVVNTSTTTTATTSTTTVVAQTTTTESITTQLSSGISDATVSSVVTTKTTSTNAEANPAAAVKLTAPASAPATTAATNEKKDEGSNTNASNNNSPSSSDNKPSDSPKTARQELAEKRREAAAKEAVAKGKDLANEMGKAADMEAQKAVQNVVIQAMGFTPGFDTYNKSMIPDTTFYKPFTVYGNQRNVDNQNVSRRLMGGSDRVHQEMIDSQFNKGN
jgi:hypothetical protein